MRLLGVLSLPIIYLNRVIRYVPFGISNIFSQNPLAKNSFRSSSSSAAGGSSNSFIVLLLAFIFFFSVCLINNVASFDYQKFSSVSENLRYYMKLDRSFFKLPVFAATHFSAVKPKNKLLDPRVSINVYLEELVHFYSDKKNVNKRPSTNFDWADWVDVSQADLFIESYQDIVGSIDNDHDKIKEILTKFCYEEMQDKRDPWIDEDLHEKNLFFDEQLKSIGICSAIWKKYYLHNPERLIFETDKKYFEFDVKERKSDLADLKAKFGITHDNKANTTKNTPTREDNLKLTYKLLDTYSGNGGELKDLHLPVDKSLKKEDFEWDPEADLENLKKQSSLSKEDEKYRDFLQYAKDHAVQPHFYFTFPGLRVDRNAELHHYNFPFIRQIISHEERIAVIHHLVRAWFKLCENYGIVTWINYGNLIGWWFNAQNLPWDNDIDAQVSIQDLNKIGRYLNNSLIIENPKSGNGLFWLQTNHVYSQQGSGNNFIDARFIDARSGIYIDISALWNTDHKIPDYLEVTPNQIKNEPEKYFPVHCKHLQFFTLEDLFPLRRTIYEGAQAYIPRKVERILKRFYGDRPFNSFKCFDHNYQSDIGLWVPDEICKDPPSKDQVRTRFDSRGDLTLEGACGNSDLQDWYNRAKDSIKLHWQEFEEFFKKDKEPIELTKEDLPVFRDDPFESFIKFEEQHGTRNYG